MTAPGPPAALLEVAAGVEQRLAEHLDAELAAWSATDPELHEPLIALRDLVVGGGKRLRAAFCHWAYVGAGGDDPSVAIDAGAAFELLHAFALVHDDVMDGSTLRRRQPTVHHRFASRHTGQTWRGEARRFGDGVAILVGDLAFVYADQLLPPLDAAATDIWHRLRLELNAGQYLDLLGAARGATDLDTARRIVTYKSAKYTVERPLHLGAALAGRLDDLRPCLSAYGLPLGEAFQLRDDLLGAFGDIEVIGKPVGDDLREGKPTPLLALARAQVTEPDRAVLERVGDPALDADGVAAVQDVLRRSGAVTEVEHRIGELVGTARAALTGAPLSADACDALAELAHYVGWRDR